jgi:ABC-type nitrate/sulfonate/bicarbonate transport system substrate-binding protein
MQTRRAFLGGAAATGIAAVIGRARAADTVTVLTGFGFLPNFIDLMNAHSGGHFQKAGLDATVVGARGTAVEMQQMIAGQAAFGRVAAIDQMNAIAKQQAPLVSISTLAQGSTFQVISLKEKPVADAASLQGKTVGVVSVGGSTEMLLDLMLRKAGLTKDAVKIETVGDNPGAIEFLARGRVDCFLASLNTVVAIERSGGEITYWSTDRFAEMPGQVYLATKSIIDTSPDTVLRFCKAMKASVDELLTQPLAPIFERAARDFDIPGLTDMDKAVATQQATAKQLWLADGRENLLRNVPRRWEAGVATLRGAGMTGVPDATMLYTNHFIDAALKA